MTRFVLFLLIVMAGLCTILVCCSNPDPTETMDLSDTDQRIFQRIESTHSGIHFANQIDERYEHFFEFFAYVYNGGGVAVGDLNQDGLPDLYFTGNEVEDHLYFNMGNLQFENVTNRLPSQANEGWNNGVTFVDINNDGWLDIYVCRGGWQDDEADRTNLLYINHQGETFTEEAAAYGLDENGYSMHALFFDMDNDNDLDVYMINRPDSFYLPLSLLSSRAITGDELCRDKLYRNNEGRYEEIGRKAGIQNYGYSLGITSGDFNQDGYTDLFVANDYSTPDHLYMNQGDGTFRDEVQSKMNHISLFSMGTDAADINNDGLDDLIVMEMRPDDYVRSKVSMPSMNATAFHATVAAGMHKQFMHNMLHVNRGDGYFSEVSQLAGIAKTDWSWSCLAADLDLDGNRDLFITNGMRRDLFDGDVQLRLAEFLNRNRAEFKTPADLFGKGFKGIVNSYNPVKINNYLFHNEGNFHFEDVSEIWGLAEPSFSNGAVLSDLDGDGDLDIVINNLDDPAFIYENKSRSKFHWIKIDLQGPDGNSVGLGAKVYVHCGHKQYYFEQKVVRGYLSSQDPILHFGLSANQWIDSLIVVWPDGNKNRLLDQNVDQLLKVSYADASTKAVPSKEAQPIFEDVTSKMLHPLVIDREDQFDEYQEQILLPHSFSTFGPKLSTGDVNDDGNDDLYIGGSAGESGRLYLSNKSGWIQSEQPAFEVHAYYEDMMSCFFDYDEDGDLDLFVVSGGSSRPDMDEFYRDRLYENEGGIFKLNFLTKERENGSTVLPVDFDGDGDEDLFVGGFVRPGRYPNAASSYILFNENGDWRSVDQGDLGILYCSASADLNLDGEIELVTAGEWTEISIHHWDGEQLIESTKDFGLDQTRGWWSSLLVDDIDGDGDQDLIAGNLGENYKFHANENEKFSVFARDFDGNGSNDIFLAKESSGKLLPIRGKECTSQQMPEIERRFSTFQSFAEAELPAIIGHDLTSATNKSVDLFSSVTFINEDGRYQLQTLPMEAQFSVVNAILPIEMNNDGFRDLILAGNRFHTEVETTPSDASFGLLLLSSDSGQLQSVPSGQSGLFLNGDIKDMKLVEHGDRRYLISTENSGPVRVLQIN